MNGLVASLFVGALAVGLVVEGGLGCSSSSSGGPSGSSSGSSGGSGGSGGGSSGGNECECSVNDNGAMATIACGGSQCVNGTTYTCSSSAVPATGGACMSGSGSGGGSGSGSGSGSGGGSSSGGSGCSLFTCMSTSDCGGIAPCMSTSTGTDYCYEQEADPASCSSGTTSTSGTVNGMQVTLCVPSGCPQPVAWVQ